MILLRKKRCGVYMSKLIKDVCEADFEAEVLKSDLPVNPPRRHLLLAYSCRPHIFLKSARLLQDQRVLTHLPLEYGKRF